jgi:hypothetical protein
MLVVAGQRQVKVDKCCSISAEVGGVGYDKAKVGKRR